MTLQNRVANLQIAYREEKLRLGVEAPVSETEGDWLRLKERFREGRGVEGQVEERDGERMMEEAPIVQAPTVEDVPTPSPSKESPTIPIPILKPIIKKAKVPEIVEVTEEVEDPSLKGLSKGEREIILLRRKFGTSCHVLFLSLQILR